MANEYGNSTIWDLVYEQTGDWNKAWEAYNSADASTRDNNWWDNYAGNEQEYSDNLGQYNDQENLGLSDKLDWNKNLDEIADISKKNKEMGASDTSNNFEWLNTGDNREKVNKAYDVYEMNPEYFNQVKGVAGSGLNDILSYNQNLFDNNVEEGSDDYSGAFKKAGENLENYSQLKAKTDAYRGTSKDNEYSKAFNEAADSIQNKARENILNNKDMFEGIDKYSRNTNNEDIAKQNAEQNGEDSSSLTKNLLPPNSGMRQEYKNYNNYGAQLSDVNNNNDIQKAIFYAASQSNPNLLTSSESSIEGDTNKIDTDKEIEAVINNTLNKDLNDTANQTYKEWYDSSRLKKNTDPTQISTDSAWTNLWRKYDDMAEAHGGKNAAGYAYADAHFGDIPLTEEEEYLIRNDIAKNQGFANWDDMFDISEDEGKKFKSFRSLNTGEDSYNGAKELDYNDKSRGFDTGDKSGGKGQRYHGQDYVEKLYGRTAQDRMKGQQGQDYGGNENMFSEYMQDETGNGYTTLSDYQKYVTEENPLDLTQMLEEDPGRIKKLVGGNTYGLNDTARRMVNKGLTSPKILNTQKNEYLTGPESDIMAAITSSDSLKNAIKSGKDLMDIIPTLDTLKNKDSDIDFYTGLLNTYLNAADLSKGKDAATQNLDINSDLYNGNIDLITAAQEANKSTEDALNKFLNYNEPGDDTLLNYQLANNTNESPKSNDELNKYSRSYNVFGDDQGFKWDKYDMPTSPVDLQSLYKLAIPDTYMAKVQSGKQKMINPFNKQLLYQALGRK